MKKFGDMKRFCIFAAFLPRTILLLCEVAVFFIAANSAVFAANIGYHYPVDYCASRSVIVLGRMGGDSLSYLFNNLIFCSPMPRATENASMAKHSTRTRTSAYESGTSNATLTLQVSNPHSIVCFSDLAVEMQKHFDVEKNAKNKAYAFILSCGLLTQFDEFCRFNHSDNWHDTCLRQLELLVTNEN